ncbi:carbohydrate esterase family 16 protein [Wolfiporia cocos MD-104 SS10]|uniref:Carbohydrate esterase family 16 protein n=1 Tax=Wolfiporia cocos (strain MD-104) TaxID=742152 RepID=A0A2H3JDT4_WOLCO|nr:carbohydrate esterase family 16 protein [Wolfiporia cocos MD-104 SS10]
MSLTSSPTGLVIRSRKHVPTPLHVYDYAGRGDNVSGLRQQDQQEFLPHPNPGGRAGLSMMGFAWIGFNEMPLLIAQRSSFVNAETYVAELFKTQDELHNARGCNILLINLYPVTDHRRVIKAMDSPTAFDFETEDVRKTGSGMWIDRLHSTSKMHDLVARDLAQFLQDVTLQSAATAATAELSHAGPAATAGIIHFL